jgi:hypothetical protein
MYNAGRRGGHTRWTAASARERFADLVRGASEGPQQIYSRDRLVAVLIDPETYEAFEAWRSSRKSIADAFDEVRMVAREEDWTFEAPERKDRASPFDDDDAD